VGEEKHKNIKSLKQLSVSRAKLDTHLL